VGERIRALEVLVLMGSVDVFIPNYNYARWLWTTIESVLTQEGVDLRVCVVDNASTDNSVEVVRAAMATDSRVHLIEHAENMGLIASLNDGVNWATGDYAINLSADDALAPGWLASAVAALDANPQAAFAFGPARVFNQTLPEPRRSPRRTVTVHEGTEFISSTCALGANRIRSPEGIFRVSVQREVGPFSQSLPYSSDMGMWLGLASRGSVIELRGPVAAFYRMHGTNMSTGDHLQALSDLEYPLAAIEEWYDRDGDRVPGSAAMVVTAHKKFARMAMRRIPIAFLREPTNPQSKLFEGLVAFALENDPSLARQVERIRTIASSRPVQRVGVALAPATSVALKTRRVVVAARVRRGLM